MHTLRWFLRAKCVDALSLAYYVSYLGSALILSLFLSHAVAVHQVFQLEVLVFIFKNVRKRLMSVWRESL
jgi:hypothetical protein